MRTDAAIDKRKVLCRNASTFGYGKHEAQVGDLVHFKSGTESLLGRMIGRIRYAPKLEGDKQPIRGYILCVCINHRLHHMFERWVDPLTVTEVESPRDHAHVVSCFLSDDLVDTSVDMVRRSVEWGGSLFAYRKWLAKNAADLADYELRHPKAV